MAGQRPLKSTRVSVVEDPEQVAVLAHPIRVAILNALREPNSASGVARAIGESRQKTHYHVKALLDAGLIRPTQELRSGGFVEQLYESVARSFLVSPRLAWTGDRRVDALRSQLPLEHLVHLGETLQREATALLDRAAFDAEDIPCATVDASVRFKDEETRSAFITEYMAALKPLLKKYGSQRGSEFRVAIAVFPTEGKT
jgi:DNA-binding transcriptional ArsR family regulator